MRRRIALGLLLIGGVGGVAIGLGGLLAARRRWWNRSIAAALPRWVESAVGACAACAAAVVLSGQAVDAVLVTRGTGAGASLALAIAAAGCAVGFAVAGRRRARRPLISQ